MSDSPWKASSIILGSDIEKQLDPAQVLCSIPIYIGTLVIKKPLIGIFYGESIGRSKIKSPRFIGSSL